MADGITRIAVEGFKSISKRQEIEIAPLTILAGANSSGKSSIMQPLLMLKQTLETTFDPGALWIGGPNVKFANGNQFFSKVTSRYMEEVAAETAVDSFGIELSSCSKKFKTAFRWGNNGFEVIQQESTDHDKIQLIRPDMTQEEIRHELSWPAYSAKLSVVRNRFLLNLGVSGGAPTTNQWIEPFVRRLIHVPGSRGNPSRTYPVAAPGPSFPGTFEYYVASVIHHWQSQEPERHQSLNADLEHLGLTTRVHAKKLSDAEIDLLVSRLPAGDSYDMVSVADVGLGLGHALPVLVSLRTAADGDMVYIEQPEVHLHPRAQTDLADVLSGAARRGVRVVTETHSSLLLRAVQTLVARGELLPDLVRLHWFSRDKDGVTQVSSATPDANGAFGDWPEDFGDVALHSEQEYLDAVESKLAR